MLARLAGPALAAAALAACAAPAGLDLGGLPPALPARAEIAAVPFLPQDELQCGPAALATALTWSGAAVTPGGAGAGGVHARARGHLQPDLLSAARRHGRLAVPVADLAALLAELAAGHPVLVLQNLGLALGAAMALRGRGRLRPRRGRAGAALRPRGAPPGVVRDLRADLGAGGPLGADDPAAGPSAGDRRRGGPAAGRGRARAERPARGRGERLSRPSSSAGRTASAP